MSFGTRGKVIFNITHFNIEAKSVLVQQDGKLVIAGYVDRHFDEGPWDFLALRYLNNGTLDSSFGINGTTQTDFGNREDCKSAVLQNDGKILLAGTYYPGDVTEISFALSRYNSDNIIMTKDIAKRKVYSNSVALNKLKLYPNPASNILNVEGLPSNTKTKLTITDLNGNILMTATTNAASFAWNISRLQKVVIW